MIVMNDRALQDVPLPFGQAFVEEQLSQGQTKEEINEILEDFRTPAEWPWTGSDSNFALTDPSKRNIEVRKRQ